MDPYKGKCKHGIVHHKLCDAPYIKKTLKGLRLRMGKCEESLMKKDSNIAFLKFNLEEVKKHLNEKTVEVDFMKHENKRLKMEVETEITTFKDELEEVKKRLAEKSETHSAGMLKELKTAINDGFKNLKKQLNEKSLEVDVMKKESKNLGRDLKEIKEQQLELKQAEGRMENLLLKNTVLEQRVLLMENQLLHTSEKVDYNIREITTAKGNVQDLKNITETQVLEVADVKDVLEELKKSLAGIMKELKCAVVKQELEELKKSLAEILANLEDVTEFHKLEIRLVKDELEKSKKSLLAEKSEMQSGSVLKELTSEINNGFKNLMRLLNKKSLEVDFTKSEIKNLRRDLTEIKKKYLELKQVEVKVGNLLLKNDIHEKKIVFLETELLHAGEKREYDATELVTATNIDFTMDENKSVGCDSKEIKKQHSEFKSVEIKVDSMLRENSIQERKVLSLENQLLHTREMLQHNEREIATAVGNVHDVRDMTEIQVLEVKAIKDELEDLKKSLAEMMNVLKSAVAKVEIDDLKKCLAGMLKDYKSAINYDLRRLNDDVQNSVNEKFKHCSEGSLKIEELTQHVKNIENLIFYDVSVKEITLQWELQNYKYYHTIGKVVLSPIFFTQVTGYCFKFAVSWNGSNKEDLDVGLCLCRGSDDEILEPFNVPHTIEMLDKNGNIKSGPIDLNYIKEYMNKRFMILPGQNMAQEGYAYSRFLTMPDLQNFIVNDTIFIRCRFSLP